MGKTENTQSVVNILKYVNQWWQFQMFFVTDRSRVSPLPQPVCLYFILHCCIFLFHSKHLLLVESISSEPPEFDWKLMSTTFCCNLLMLLLRHNCWRFGSNSSAAVYRFSDLSAGNFWAKTELNRRLWSRGQVFRFQVWLWFNQQRFLDQTLTQTRTVAFSLGFSNANSTCRCWKEFIANVGAAERGYRRKNRRKDLWAKETFRNQLDFKGSWGDAVKRYNLASHLPYILLASFRRRLARARSYIWICTAFNRSEKSLLISDSWN